MEPGLLNSAELKGVRASRTWIGYELSAILFEPPLHPTPHLSLYTPLRNFPINSLTSLKLLVSRGTCGVTASSRETAVLR